MSSRSRSSVMRCAARPQRGIVMFIALIAMVVLSLAGIGVVRSVDTSASVAGNIAFRQASIVAVNRAIEESVDAIYKSKTIADFNADDLPHNYYASLQAGEKPDGTPAVLAGPYPPSGFTLAYYTDPTTGLEVRHIIERVCNAPGAQTVGRCDLLPPKVSPAGTDNEYKRIPIPSIPNYRVSVRVDLPNTNTTTVAQGFLE